MPSHAVDPERRHNAVHSPRPHRGPWRKRDKHNCPTCTSCFGDVEVEFDCCAYLVWIVGAFFALLSVDNATQVPFFAIQRPATDAHPAEAGDSPSYGLETAPNWHALLGFRGSKLWADPALFYGPHRALLAVLLMMLAVSWLRFHSHGRDMHKTVQGRRMFHLSDNELADPELAPSPDPRAEEGEEIEAGFDGVSLNKPFTVAAVLMFLHALPIVAGNKPGGLPHLGFWAVVIGLVFSLFSSFCLIAHWAIEKKVDGGLAKLKAGAPCKYTGQLPVFYRPFLTDCLCLQICRRRSCTRCAASTACASSTATAIRSAPRRSSTASSR